MNKNTDIKTLKGTHLAKIGFLLSLLIGSRGFLLTVLILREAVHHNDS